MKGVIRTPLTALPLALAFICGLPLKMELIPFDYIPDHREQLKLPRLVINNHKSFIRVVEIPATKTTLVEGNQDFVFLEKTSEKVRYSTLKLQELNAKMKALQEENEQIQRALSEDLCNQVNKIQCSHNQSPFPVRVILFAALPS